MADQREDQGCQRGDHGDDGEAERDVGPDGGQADAVPAAGVQFNLHFELWAQNWAQNWAQK